MAGRRSRPEPRLGSPKRAIDRAAAVAAVQVLAMAGVGLGLGALAGFAAVFTGDDEAEFLWMRVGASLGADPVGVRIAVFGVAQALLGAVLWRPLAPARAALAGALDRLTAGPAGRWAGAVGTALALGVLVPFGVQPTLVPLSARAEDWAARAANLLDGTATSAVGGSLAATWRRLSGAGPYGGYSVSSAEGGLDAPLMTRWDPLLRAVTSDREHYAQTRAFLYVESGGRQYAVSRTGCAGLMQFCVTTAQRRPFAGIFGAGAVSACDCGGRPCAVPADVARALETDPVAVGRHRASFPCDPRDARFDPERALRAGAAYTAELAAAFGGNLELMYVGYNSGPAVARRIWRARGQDASIDLEDLRERLAPALARWYGEAAEGRARGLLEVHLPKLRRAYEDGLTR